MTLSVLLDYTLKRVRRLAEELGAQEALDRLDVLERSLSPFVDEQVEAVREVVVIAEDLLRREDWRNGPSGVDHRELGGASSLSQPATASDRPRGTGPVLSRRRPPGEEGGEDRASTS